MNPLTFKAIGVRPRTCPGGKCAVAVAAATVAMLMSMCMHTGVTGGGLVAVAVAVALALALLRLIASRRKLCSTGGCRPDSKGKRLEGWGSPILAMAPMVGQSERPFRMLCRKYGATVCWTEMFMAHRFATDQGYLIQALGRAGVHADDHPLVVQFAANNARDFSAAALAAEVLGADAVDLNLGCPQRRAKQVCARSRKCVHAFVQAFRYGSLDGF